MIIDVKANIEEAIEDNDKKHSDESNHSLPQKVLPIVVMRESKYNILFQNCLVVRHPVYYIYLSPDTSKP